MLNEGEKLGGYFWEFGDSRPDEFAIATGKSLRRWFPTFVHEYNHFKQKKNKTSAWMVLDDCKVEGSEDPIFDWINDKIKISDSDIKKIIDGQRDMELECERNTIQDIKDHNLPVELEWYSKTCAAYIYFYNFVYENKSWSKWGKEPYKSKEILAKMPDNLDGDFSTTPKSILQLMKKHCL